VGDYTRMSSYYDLIMTSGYYDYDAIVDGLAGARPEASVLEVGAGTGLVLERLVARRPDLAVAGVDLTQAMLDIAVDRLAPHAQVTLYRQDVVTLSLGRRFDLAFSYGGVWYFVPGEGGHTMISHIRDDAANAQGLRRVAEHLDPGGRLLLGVQAPHADYTSPVAGGLLYSQRISPIEGGFRKNYRLDDGSSGAGAAVMDQTTDYRTYCFDAALELLEKAGFEYRERAGESDGLFLEFDRR
jgi:SAM-dependent methyltransferase